MHKHNTYGASRRRRLSTTRVRRPSAAARRRGAASMAYMDGDIVAMGGDAAGRAVGRTTAATAGDGSARAR